MRTSSGLTGLVPIRAGACTSPVGTTAKGSAIRRRTASRPGVGRSIATTGVRMRAMVAPEAAPRVVSCFQRELVGLLNNRCSRGYKPDQEKNLVSLSEQELIDCDTEVNQGCNGGLMAYAFEFIKNGGITSEDAYPYAEEDQTCQSKKNSPVVTVDGHQNVPLNNENALTKAVANQPVSVAIEASGYAFQFYSEGVFTGSCGADLDHGVAFVGYGTTRDGTQYWTVRNSWGPEWGESGYIRMKRGIKDKRGLCGIAREASYPIKTSPHPEKDEI